MATLSLRSLRVSGLWDFRGDGNYTDILFECRGCTIILGDNVEISTSLGFLLGKAKMVQFTHSSLMILTERSVLRAIKFGFLGQQSIYKWRSALFHHTGEDLLAGATVRMGVEPRGGGVRTMIDRQTHPMLLRVVDSNTPDNCLLEQFSIPSPSALEFIFHDSPKPWPWTTTEYQSVFESVTHLEDFIRNDQELELAFHQLNMSSFQGRCRRKWDSTENFA